MITLESFYDLISRNAQVTLESAMSRRNLYTGNARNIPDEYSICPVENFRMNNNGTLTFQIRVPRKRSADSAWKEGAIREGANIYHYWVKACESASPDYGIGGGRIIKLTLRRKEELVCNYDRGWDVQPVDEETRLVMDRILGQYR